MKKVRLLIPFIAVVCHFTGIFFFIINYKKSNEKKILLVSCLRVNEIRTFFSYNSKKKNPQHAFLRRGSKAVIPCRRFAACKRSLNLCGSWNLGKITGKISRPLFHLSLLGSLRSLRTYRHLAAKVGTSKGGGKQWQTTPKNLPRMQCARAIPVT